MSIGLIGRKCGMTRIFTETGSSIPVTVVEVILNRITQVKTVETDGYRAFQVAYGKKSSARVNKPLAGHYSKAAVEAGNALREFRLGNEELTEAKAGDELKVDIFKEGQVVDVRGLTRGKGFAGTVNAIIFEPRTLLTVILCRIVPRALLVNAKHRDGYGKVKRWLVSWAMFIVLCRVRKLSKWT